MKDLKPCPVCSLPPTVTVEDKGSGQFLVSVQCVKHQHMALGDTERQARSNWNIYVTLLKKQGLA